MICRKCNFKIDDRFWCLKHHGSDTFFWRDKIKALLSDVDWLELIKRRIFMIGKYIKNIESENIRAFIVPIYFVFTMMFDMIPRMVMQGYRERVFMQEFWTNNYAIFKVLLCGGLNDKNK